MAHEDPNKFVKQFLDNFMRHAFEITGNLVLSGQDLVDKKFYKFGRDVGSVVQKVIN